MERPRLRFHIVRAGWNRSPNVVNLRPNDWDDFRYRTLFEAHFFDKSGHEHLIGAVKIGQYGLEAAPPRAKPKPGLGMPLLENSFRSLSENEHFSLGQDPSYYEAINEIDTHVEGFRRAYLNALNDMAFHPDTYVRALAQDVTQQSLLRAVTVNMIENQFARLARGQKGPEGFEFQLPIRDEPGAAILPCTVVPDAKPPQNIHVLIGSNGAGKSTMLHDIAKMLAAGSEHQEIEQSIEHQRVQLANLVSVSFSAFDKFRPIDATGLAYHYVGIKTRIDDRDTDAELEYEVPVEFHDDTFDVELDMIDDYDSHEDGPSEVEHWRPLTPNELDAQTVDAVYNCVRVEDRRGRLVQTLTLLESDPNFASLGIRDIVENLTGSRDIGMRLRRIIARLSSGHTIVLLAMARLIETVVERTLVLIDEPEAHLHPPLLSALMRALSGLLTDRNGLAIVATHSPVVLQEVPKSCVHIVDNTFDAPILRAPHLETFGENVGTLTGEVFGLAVEYSGFHAMLREVADREDNYAAALQVFNGQLGAEGRAILRSMISAKARGRDGDVGR